MGQYIMIGAAVVIVLVAAGFGWWFENGGSDKKAKDRENPDSDGKSK